MNMRCRKIRKLISDYIDDELGGNKRKLVEEHLKQCQGCGAFFKGLQATENVTRQKIAQEPSSAYWANYWPRLNEKIERTKLSGFNILEVKERVLDWAASFELVPSLWFATNIAVIVVLFSFVFLVHKQGRHMQIVQNANNQLAQQANVLSQKYAKPIQLVKAKKMPAAVLPVVAIDKDMRIFQGIEDSFPGRMEWVTLNNGKIEMGINQEGYGVFKGNIVQQAGALFYLEFAIAKKTKSGEVAVVSSPKMMILNEREINVKFDSPIDGKKTAFRYECLPKLKSNNQIELFAKIDVDGSLLQTNLLLAEGKSAELGTISRGADIYIVSVTAQKRKYQVKSDEMRI
jgi:hypothetical protein